MRRVWLGLKFQGWTRERNKTHHTGMLIGEGTFRTSDERLLLFKIAVCVCVCGLARNKCNFAGELAWILYGHTHLVVVIEREGCYL